jgi:hypothetical protein
VWAEDAQADQTRDLERTVAASIRPGDRTGIHEESAVAAYLNSPAAGDLDGSACGEALEQLGAITSLLGAAANGLLRRFVGDESRDADGYTSSAAWLAARTRLGRKDVKAVRQMRLLSKHPLLDEATAGGVTIS